ncbi:NAD(P)-binding domain-containing protein [Actinomycetospora endophytica]|uniref:NAD(P)-binding domain-containing protein n=1 Tax=Actinomycetospora endophytica TaxID=2291215 RepID=A0ABS8PBX2_9PSEU|nr:NAD(P)-binding domain-containing protein [Actinomycetospora endophytica]MCD2195751.1 NAD(P)-binding domain-containing protein [Actinomycetospora endophytica]
MMPPEAAEPALHVLTTDDVGAVLAVLDPVAVVRDTLAAHARGDTTLPDEAYLPWHTRSGAFARSLALPGAVWGERPAVGLKVINSSLENPERGMPRAQGLTLLFDAETARPVAMMPAAAISATRTAAYTALSVRLLAVPEVRRIAVLGCGALARTHVDLLRAECPQAEFVVHDLVPERAAALADEVGATTAAVARGAVEGAEVVVCTTTVTEGYIGLDWLAPGALVAHVSLDDLLPEAVTGADLLVVDDWDLVAADDRRILGRMWRRGEVVGPAGERRDPDHTGGRAVDAAMADVVAGTRPGRAAPGDRIVSNPFGMGVLDVALAAEVLDGALAEDRGTPLTIF